MGKAGSVPPYLFKKPSGDEEMNQMKTPQTRMPILGIVAFLVFCGLPGNALAQGVSIPSTSNPYLIKIARHYDALEYEDALKLFSSAERYSTNKPADRLWLELMRGVLYYSTGNNQSADAAFRRALEQSPYNSLPVLEPSQTLYERFNALRAEVLQSRNSKPVEPVAKQPEAPPAAPGEPLPPQEEAIPDSSELSTKTLLGRLGELKTKVQSGGAPLAAEYVAAFSRLNSLAQKAKTPNECQNVAAWMDLIEDLISQQIAVAADPPETEEELTNTDSHITRSILMNRALVMKKWLLEKLLLQGSTEELHQDLLNEVETWRARLLRPATADERMKIALRLDKVHSQLSLRFKQPVPGGSLSSQHP